MEGTGMTPGSREILYGYYAALILDGFAGYLLV